MLELDDGPAVLHTLQLLSHESKISTRVELHVGWLSGSGTAAENATATSTTLAPTLAAPFSSSPPSRAVTAVAAAAAAAVSPLLRTQQQQRQRQYVWTKLGVLAFDANERSGHAARELKSVSVPRGAGGGGGGGGGNGAGGGGEATGLRPCSALRLVFWEPHASNAALNPGRQVGLVALNVVGENVGVGGGGGSGGGGGGGGGKVIVGALRERA